MLGCQQYGSSAKPFWFKFLSVMLQLCLQNEPFAPVFTVVKVPSVGVEDYLDKAVALANDGLWGTLSANLIVDPTTQAKHNGMLLGMRYMLV